MQNTQERPWEGKLKKQETKAHFPLLENNSSFNCASLELDQILTFWAVEKRKSDLEEKKKNT